MVESLKRLAILEPVSTTRVDASDVESLAYELIESDEISHYFILTTLAESALRPEIAQRTQIISY